MGLGVTSSSPESTTTTHVHTDTCGVLLLEGSTDRLGLAAPASPARWARANEKIQLKPSKSKSLETHVRVPDEAADDGGTDGHVEKRGLSSSSTRPTQRGSLEQVRDLLQRSDDRRRRWPLAQQAESHRCRRCIPSPRETMANLASLTPTFLASLRAVGTAATMAFAGFYLHRRSFVTPSGRCLSNPSNLVGSFPL